MTSKEIKIGAGYAVFVQETLALQRMVVVSKGEFELLETGEKTPMILALDNENGRRLVRADDVKAPWLDYVRMMPARGGR